MPASVLTGMDVLELSAFVAAPLGGTFTEIDDVVQPSPLPRFSRTPGKVRHRVVPPGRHSGEILVELGLKASEIGDLVERGMIHVHE